VNPYLADLIRYAESFLHTPYLYGGKTARGYDCSGFICELMKSIGLIGYHEILSAQGLHNRFSQPERGSKCDKTAPGALLFFGKPGHAIEHVAMTVNPYSLVEAGGGDSRTISITMAESIDARVRKRGVNYRSDLFAAIMPKYPWL
jgi:cell wall-associated NlpC family hydrolase